MWEWKAFGREQKESADFHLLALFQASSLRLEPSVYPLVLAPYQLTSQ
jgi:hypothetical protein